MAEQGMAILKSREVQRQAYVDEFKKLWGIVGGTDFAVASTPEELIDKAIQHGATDRQVSSFLALQQSFKGIEEVTERMRNDPAYEVEVARQAAEFDQWVENASNTRNGIFCRLVGFFGVLLR